MSGCRPACDDRFLKHHFLPFKRGPFNGPAVTVEDAMKAVQKQRLAGAVMSQQQRDASPPDVGRYGVEQCHAVPREGQVPRFQDDVRSAFVRRHGPDS